MENFTNFRPGIGANKTRRWFGLLTLCMMFFVGQISQAQTTVSLGTSTGTGSTNVLLSTSTTSNNYSRTISLYTSSEILLAGGMPGNITSLAWDKNGAGEYTSADAYIKIYLKHVSNELWGSVPEWNTEVLGATEVFTSSTYSIPTGIGWKEVNFTTPFEWNGADNIAVFVEWHRLSAPTGDIAWGRSTTTSASASRVGSTSLDALVMLINSNRPLLQLTITPSGPITCPIPTALSIDNIASDSAELSWVSDGDLFEIEYGEVGFTQGTGTTIQNITGSPYTFTNLDPQTAYQFFIRRDCGTDDGVSSWIGSSFTTSCGIVSTGFYEGFETTPTGSSSNPTVPQCWNMIDTGAGYGYTSATSPNTAPRNFYMYNGSASDTGHYILVSPQTDDLGNGTMRVKFWARTTVTTQPATQLDFGTLSDNTDETTFTSLQTFDLTTTYTEYQVIIPTTTDDYFGFRHDLTTKARYIYIDTITYEPIPSCLEITESGVAGITYTSADIEWISTGTLFDIEYGESGFIPTETPSAGYSGITGTSHTITGLDPETTYDYYIRQDCGGGDISVWTGPFSFYTGYCIPSVTSTSTLYRITGFSTTDGYTNISNENNGITDSYNDFTNMVVTQSPGGTFNYSISVAANAMVEVWIDLDQNMVFDPEMELLAAFGNAGTSPASVHEGSMMIPVGTPLGDYRFRIRSRYYSGTTATPCGTITNGETEDYTLTVVAVPTCMPPSDLNTSNISSESADLSWISSGTDFDIIWGTSGFDPETEGTVVSDFANGGTLTDLSANTTYQFYVRQDCGDDGVSLWAGPFSFTTECGIMSTGFYEGFETTPTGSSSNPTVPQCWNMIDTGAGYGYTSATSPNTAPRNFYMYNGSASDTGHYILVSPQTDDLGNGTMRVKFWARTTVTTQPATQLDFGTLSDNTDETTFTSLQTFDLTTTYTEYQVIIPATTDDYFGFRHDLTTKARYIYIDTITYEPIPSCLEITESGVAGITYTSADIEWISTGTLFDIEYGESGFIPTETPSAGYSGITGTSHTITGLDPETTYDYYIRQDCGGGDISVWTGPFSFYTGYCIPSVTSTSTLYRITGFSTTDGYTNISNENNGITNAYNDFTDQFVTQSPGGTFNYSISVAANAMVEVWIDLDQNMVFDPEMELLAAFGNAGTSPASVHEGSMLIPVGTPPGEYRFRIRSRYYSGTTATPCGTITNGETEDYTLMIIDTPNCLPPIGLGTENISYDSADLFWILDGGTSFDIEYGEAGFTPAGTPSTGLVAVSNPYTLTGLTPETDYQYYVRQNCGGIDGESIWVGPYSFTTECLPPAMPVATGGTVCGLGEVTLSATAETGASVAWYDAETDGTKLGEGETFITPELSETTSFWVAAYTGDGVTPGQAKQTFTGTSPGGYTQTAGLEFVATGSFTIVSVVAYSYATTGTSIPSLRLEDSSGNILQEITNVPIPNGGTTGATAVPFTITLNFDVPGPGTYRLMANGTFSSLARDSGATNAAFPHDIGDVAQITQGILTAASATSYYFFYDWTIGGGCYSDRTEVIATVTASPALELSTDEASICEGETPDTVTITTGAADYDTFAWEPSTGVTGDAATGWTFTPTETTTYTLTASQSAGVCATLATYTVTVNPIPEFALNITEAAMCIGDSPLMLATLPFTLAPGTETGCTTGTTQFPAAAYTPANCDGTVYDITTGGWAGEFSVVNVIEGNIYTFSSSIATDITTISNADGTTVYTAGTGNVHWVATYTGQVRMYTHLTGCDSQTSSRTRRVACLVAAPVTWSPETGLYMDAAGTIAYTGTEEFAVYASPAATTIYTATATNSACSSEQSVEVTVNPIPDAPTGAATQTLEDGDTLADLVVNGTDLVWYANADLTQEIPDITVVTDGTTYYVVSESGACQSNALAVTVILDPCTMLAAPTGDAAQSLTLGDTLADLDVTGTGLVWYSNENLTTIIPDTTAAVDGTTYYVVATTDDCQSDALAITVTVIDPCASIVTPTGATEQSLLLGQTIAGLNVDGQNLVWYADEDLTQEIPDTTLAVNGTTYYVVSETGDCQSDALAITVTVIDPCAEITTPTGDTVQIVAEGTTLAELEVDGDNLAWYADAELTQSLPATTVVQSGVTYYVASVTDICQSEPLAITVVIEGTNPCQDVTIPAPTGDAEQTVDQGTTLAELVVEGENLQWYADAELTEPLEDTHVAEDDTTYYVTQTIGVCTGEALAVTVDVTLGRTDFESFAFRFYPNPVGDVLNLTSNVEISQIDLFNMLGQKVTVITNANNTQVDMSGLPTGNYIISVTIEGITKTFKVVKN